MHLIYMHIIYASAIGDSLLAKIMVGRTFDRDAAVIMRDGFRQALFSNRDSEVFQAYELVCKLNPHAVNIRVDFKVEQEL